MAGGASCSLSRLRGMSSRLLTHAGCQPLRLPLRYAHRVPLHPGHYGRGLHRPSKEDRGQPLEDRGQPLTIDKAA